jgi:hypothetical protein
LWAALAALVLAQAVGDENWQLALTVLFVLSAAGVYVRWPGIGLAVLLVLWSCAPLFRRLLDWLVFSPGPDLLSLAPYLATGAIGALAYQRARPPARPLVVLGMVWLGLGIGALSGVDDTLPLLYGLFAYVAASLALLVGYADWERRSLVVERVLLFLVPLIAAYGIYQYLVPHLPAWDEFWLESSAPRSVGTKEAGSFRAFSALNSPGTLAGLLALFVAMVLAARRLTPARFVVGLMALACLFFTGTRSAWVALGATLLLLVFATRGVAAIRILAVVAALGGAYFALSGSATGGQLSEQLVQRATSLSDLGGDVSFTKRLEQVTTFGPQGVSAPLGHGIGSVGQASRVSSQGFPPFDDNGYLMLLWQVGPLGLVLIVGAVLYAVVSSFWRAGAAGAARVSLLAPLIATGVLMASADALYGIGAVVFWYSLGALMAAGAGPRSARSWSTPR